MKFLDYIHAEGPQRVRDLLGRDQRLLAHDDLLGKLLVGAADQLLTWPSANTRVRISREVLSSGVLFLDLDLSVALPAAFDQQHEPAIVLAEREEFARIVERILIDQQAIRVETALAAPTRCA